MGGLRGFRSVKHNMSKSWFDELYGYSCWEEALVRKHERLHVSRSVTISDLMLILQVRYGSYVDGSIAISCTVEL